MKLVQVQSSNFSLFWPWLPSRTEKSFYDHLVSPTQLAMLSANDSKVAKKNHTWKTGAEYPLDAGYTTHNWSGPTAAYSS